MKVATLLILCFVSLFISAQDPNLRNEILSFQDTTRLLIENSRTLMLQALKEKEYERAFEIRKLLADEVDDEQYMTFSLGEEFLISTMIGTYEVISITAAKWDSLENVQSTSIPEMVREDGLFDELLQLAQRDKTDIEHMIYGPWGGDRREQQLVHLVFNAILASSYYSPLTKEDVNSQADEFLSSYPESPYDYFIKRMVREKYERVDWGLVLFMGAGAGEFNGGFSEFVDMGVPVLISFEGFYRNWMAGIRIQGGGARVQQDFNYQGDWPEGIRVNPLYAGVDVGYAIMNRDKLRVIPYAEIGGLSISPVDNKKNRPYEDLEIGSFVYGAGAIIDVMPWSSQSWIEEYRFGFRLQGGILVHNFENKDERFSGAYPFIGLGLIMDVFGIKLDTN